MYEKRQVIINTFINKNITPRNLVERIDNPEDYSQTIAERIKLKKQRYGETNMDLFKGYFSYQSPSKMLKDVYSIDKKENKESINLIKSRLAYLKNEIKKMSEDEKETERPYEEGGIVEKILYFNNQNQEGQGLTPDQMLSSLPISLAILKAGNNSEKLKNEIRQLLYSLYRLEKLLFRAKGTRFLLCLVVGWCYFGQ